jgi:hypothetical protein
VLAGHVFRLEVPMEIVYRFVFDNQAVSNYC